MQFSYSRLTTYEGAYGCPWRFYLKYVLELPEPTTPVLLLGKAAHAVIETMAKGGDRESACIAIAKTNDLEVEELLMLTSQPVINEILNPFGNAEEHFELQLPNISFQGFIDYYTVNKDFVELTDWKTNQVPYAVMDTHQLALYAAYLTEKYNLPVLGRLVFLRTGFAEEHLFTDQEIREAVSWADNLGSEILSRIEMLNDTEPETVFPKKQGQPCQYCAFCHVCEGTTNLEAITNEFEAREVAESIVKLEAQADQLKAILKPWVEKMGPVSVGDTKEFRIDESCWWKFPNGSLEKAVVLMREQGIDPLTVLRLTAEGLKKLPWTEEDLLELGAQKQISKRFVMGTKR